MRLFFRKESRARVEMTLESPLPSYLFFPFGELFFAELFRSHLCVCGASAREAMLSFEGSCIAALALYGALSLLVKLFGAAGMAKSLLGQKRMMADKPEKQEPLMRERDSSNAAASSGAAAWSAAGRPSGVENTATSEWTKMNAVNKVLEVFVTSTGSKFHLDRQCQYLRGKKVTSFGLCSCCERKRLLEQRVTTVQSGM